MYADVVQTYMCKCTFTYVLMQILKLRCGTSNYMKTVDVLMMCFYLAVGRSFFFFF